MSIFCKDGNLSRTYVFCYMSVSTIPEVMTELYTDTFFNDIDACPISV